jgi:mannosylglycoprotein endo-beta-mannosidase
LGSQPPWGVKETQERISSILEELEESNSLSTNQWQRKTWLISENLKFLDQEELYWHNRSHETWLLYGDLNTNFFHRVASGRKRKNTILSFEHGDNTIEGDENLLTHATDYYSDLFGHVPAFNIQLSEHLWDGTVSLEKNKAAGPDSIPIEFYQACWKIVKSDIIQLFADFHQGKVDISRINYGTITLLPKVSDAARIQQYRPICLLNCLYKLITKTLTIRI